MSLLLPAFHPKDLVELNSGGYMVLTRSIRPGVLMGRAVVPWTNPKEPKPKAAPETPITESEIKQVVRDEVLSWVSPAHLHLTVDGAYQSEYEFANHLSNQHGPLQLCNVSEDAILAQTKGLYVTADNKIVVTARTHTSMPLQDVLDHVISQFSLSGTPALPGAQGGDGEGRAIKLLELALGDTKANSRGFLGEDAKKPDQRWWTKQIDGKFASAIVAHLTEKAFVSWCEEKFRAELDLKSESVSDAQKNFLEKKKKQFVELFAAISKFNQEAIPACLAWLGDDRWSANIVWQSARKIAEAKNMSLSPRWDKKSAVHFAADVATKLEEFISDELVGLNFEADVTATYKVAYWGESDESEEGDQLLDTRIQVPYLAADQIRRFVGSEIGTGIVEINEPMKLQWSGDGFDDRANLRFSEPGLFVVEGAAGTGKTSLMAQRAVDAAGRVNRVLIIVPTHTFKRRLKHILRHIEYQGQGLRRNNIEVLTPDLVGGSMRDIASQKAYQPKDMSWGWKNHKGQWDRMAKLFKSNADPGQVPDIANQYISRNIAIQELRLHAKHRGGQTESDANLQIPSYGAIFVDEAQDLKGWDWLKLASYSIQYSDENFGQAPEIGVFVDRRQDIHGATPNFDFAGPDDDPDVNDDDEDNELEIEPGDPTRARVPITEPNGVLRTPLFDITRPTAAAGSLSMQFSWAPEKSLQRYAIGYKHMQAIRKTFIQCMKDSALPVKMVSLTAVLRQSKTLAENSAAAAAAIETRHGLANSLRNSFLVEDAKAITPITENIVDSMSELISLLTSQLEDSQNNELLAPRAIMVKNRIEGIALSLIAARMHPQVQSNIIVQMPNNTIVVDRNGKPLVSDDKMIRYEPLAKNELGLNVLGIFTPDKPPGKHRGLHRIGRDCMNHGARRMSNSPNWISVGTVAGLKGLEYGSLTGIIPAGQQLTLQENYVLKSRPRSQLSLIYLNNRALHDSNEYKCATVINSALPPWGGLLVCQLQILATLIHESWEDLQGPLKAETHRLKEKWRTVSGAYGVEDACFQIWGPHRKNRVQQSSATTIRPDTSY
jgi:hypothetical protein